MSDTKKSRGRGRPRGFDPDAAVATAQRLFHARGYDAVSVGDLTRALGINPPSLYAAFGSKFDLFDRVLGRYSEIGAVPLDRILRPGRPLAEALSEVLVEAARSYTADPDMSGCMVLEGLRSNDDAARAAALARRQAAEAVIHAYIADHRPEEAGRLTDYISTCMAGLSAAAVAGHDRGRLLASAKLQGLAIERALGD